MIFVDSSVWISALRHGQGPHARALAQLLDENEVALSIPVYLEVLSGAGRRDQTRLRRTLSALPIFYPSVESWSRMEEWIGHATRSGERFGVTDLLVASIAVDRQARLWSLDADFQRMARLGFVTLFGAA